MIERTQPATSRVRAGAHSSEVAPEFNKAPGASRSWIHDRAPRLRSPVRERHRREQVWAWLSLVTLIVCWDASERLDERVSMPRTRIAQVLDDQDVMRAGSGAPTFTVDL